MMNRRTAIAAFALMLSFLAPLAAHAQVAAKHRVVFQVSDNDPAKWNLALNNARNVQADLGKDEVEIEIVAYGPGPPHEATKGRLGLHPPLRQGRA